MPHILENQWLISGHYEDEKGVQQASDCINAIEGGMEAIFFHDKMKGYCKDLVRALGARYQIPITSIRNCVHRQNWNGQNKDTKKEGVKPKFHILSSKSHFIQGFDE